MASKTPKYHLDQQVIVTYDDGVATAGYIKSLSSMNEEWRYGIMLDHEKPSTITYALERQIQYSLQEGKWRSAVIPTPRMRTV